MRLRLYVINGTWCPSSTGSPRRDKAVAGPRSVTRDDTGHGDGLAALEWELGRAARRAWLSSTPPTWNTSSLAAAAAEIVAASDQALPRVPRLPRAAIREVIG